MCNTKARASLPKVVDGDDIVPIVVLACPRVSPLLKGRETWRGGRKRKLVGNESVRIRTWDGEVVCELSHTTK